MVKKTVTPATTSRRAVVPCAFRPNSFSIIAAPESEAIQQGDRKKQKAGAMLRPSILDLLPELGRSLWRNGIFMGWVDSPLLSGCHEISGIIAMQHRQHNYGSVRFGTLLVAMLIFAANPATAGSPKPDPLLHDTPQSACQAGASYVAGVDADGDPVVPADLGAARAPVPPQIVMPLPSHRRGQDSGYVVLDGRQVESLIDSKPCH